MPDTRVDYSALFEATKACDLVEVFRHLGYTVRRDLKLDPNPLRNERTPSLGVVSDNRSRWYDHGLQTGGDLVDFLQATGLDQEAARLEAAQRLGVSTTGSVARSRGCFAEEQFDFLVVLSMAGTLVLSGLLLAGLSAIIDTLLDIRAALDVQANARM